MPLNVQLTPVAGGVRVATAEMSGVESVAIGLWIGAGSRYESARQAGISHFIEHMLFKGTRSRSARAISAAIEGRGGYFNGFTQEECTCFYARIGAEHQAEVLDILFDMVRHPRMAMADLENERGVILEEIAMGRDQPQQLVQEMLGALVWANHPLGRPLVGTEEAVRALTREDLLAFKDRHYVASRTLVVAAGRVRHEDYVRSTARAWSAGDRGRAPTYKRVDRSTPQHDVAVRSKSVEQPHLALAFRLFGRHDPRRYALKLWSILLGENMSSRLFQVVRERHGLAYAIQSSVQLFEETGLLCVQAGVDRTRWTRALDLILAEIARFRDRRVGARELRRAKDFARGQVQIGLESAGNQMMWVGEHLLCYGRIVQPAEVLEQLEAVTADDIREVAGAVADRRRLSMALVAPGEAEQQADILRDRIRRF